jgi:di/tricarboxylate transporter
LTLEQIFVFALLGLVFTAFVKEWVPPDLVALSTLSVLMLTGLISTKEALAAFSNPGVLTVAAMFILSAALERTGVVEAVGDVTTKLVGRTQTLALFGIVTIGIAISAFINNTPVVVILTPVAIRLCQHLKIAPSKMLIPLSYAAIFGGSCTLIGTSTNLLVDGVAQNMGQPAFGMFEIAPFGIVMACIGVVYLLLTADRLLPSRETAAGILQDVPTRQFLTEMIVLPDADLIGKSLDEAKLTNMQGGRVIDVLRGDESLRRHLPDVRLEQGDRLLMKTGVEGLMGLRQRAGIGFEFGDNVREVATRSTSVVEGIVGPRSAFNGHRLADFNLRRRYGVYIIAVHRHGVNLRAKLEEVQLETGDTILLEGPSEGLSRLVASGDLINLSKPEHTPIRRDKAWIALATVVAVVGLSAGDYMPIVALSIVGAVLVTLTGCLPSSETYKCIEWRILFMIIGMIPLGDAMDNTGAVKLLSESIVNVGGQFGPWVILSLVYLLALVLTEIASNNAVGVLLTPIAIGIAQQLGVDPRPFIVAVMFAASAGFALPIGYQTHMFVYGAGGYKLTDFLRIGVPLDIVFWAVGSLLIPVFFPF